METTAEQNERLIADFNDRRNVSHFNLFFHNCADFLRNVPDIYFPHAIHRNFIADLGMTTPKQVARSLVKYGKRHGTAYVGVYDPAGAGQREAKSSGGWGGRVADQEQEIPDPAGGVAARGRGVDGGGYFAEGRIAAAEGCNDLRGRGPRSGRGVPGGAGCGSAGEAVAGAVTSSWLRSCSQATCSSCEP